MQIQQHTNNAAGYPNGSIWPARFQRPTTKLLPRQRYPNTSVPEAVVLCLVEARKPTQQEIEAVAHRIWIEIRGPSRQEHGGLSPGSSSYRGVIALARAALGVAPVIIGGSNAPMEVQP